MHTCCDRRLGALLRQPRTTGLVRDRVTKHLKELGKGCPSGYQVQEGAAQVNERAPQAQVNECAPQARWATESADAAECAPQACWAMENADADAERVREHVAAMPRLGLEP